MRSRDNNREALASNSKCQMKVIAAGLPRCATSSLQQALQSKWLDCYPTMHMTQIVHWPESSQLAIDALREEDRDTRQKILRKLFDGYAAISDFPGVAFIGNLMDMYPEAKIILKQRPDPKSWGKSVEEALMFFSSWTYRLTTFLIKADRLHSQMHFAAFELSQRRLGMGRPRNLETWRIQYDEYNKFVHDEERKRGRPVLEWVPKDGWTPICELLGKPVPSALPFPHCNDKRAMQKLKIILVARGLCCWALLCGAV